MAYPDRAAVWAQMREDAEDHIPDARKIVLAPHSHQAVPQWPTPGVDVNEFSQSNRDFTVDTGSRLG
jgi:hypothetical protein